MNHILPLSRTWVEISLDALRHNFAYAQKLTGKKVLCVVKADAYGHGAVRCCQCLEAAGADAFGVSCLSEALELRQAGIQVPLLILGYTAPEYAAILGAQHITQALQGEESARALSQAALQAGVTIEAHIKVDTGMGRLGIFAQTREACQAAVAEIARIYALPGLRITGIFTHFSAADDPEEDAYTRWQVENYNAILSGLKSMGLRPETCHACNSAGILRFPEAHLDMVREGIMLYGLYPDSQPHPEGPLEPVMTLKSRVAQVRDLPAGSSVSYGRTYKAQAPLRTAVINIGYADGYPRRLSNLAHAYIGGKAYPQIGRVCMDTLMVDITGNPSIRPGDEVVLWGRGAMSIEEVALLAGTVNYELTCLVTQRAARVYV